MLRLFKTIILLFIGAELLYLLLVNAALHIDWTQKTISQIKSEKFQISWKKAWSPYPFKLFVEGLSVGGSSSGGWKVDVGSAEATVALMPLLKREVKVHSARVKDVDFAQGWKNLDRVGNEKAEIETGIDTASHPQKKQSETAKAGKKKKPWHIVLEEIDASGKHSFHIRRAKGDFDGDVKIGRLGIETAGGPLYAKDTVLDISMSTLDIGKKKGVLTNSRIKGSAELLPIVFAENKGAKILPYLVFDIDIETEMGALDVLNVYLARIKDAHIEGEGALRGQIHFQKGRLLADTNATIAARRLQLAVAEYKVKGSGEIDIKTEGKDPASLNAAILFDSLQAYGLDEQNGSDEVLFFRGKGLKLAAKGSAQLFPIPPKKEILTYLSLDIPSVTVDDIGVFQRYLPPQWAFKLIGGKGMLQARAILEREQASIKVNLRSKKAKVGVTKQTFQSNLDLLMNMKVKVGNTLKADLSGSYLSLTDSVLAATKKKSKASKPWNTRLDIKESTFVLPLEKDANVTAGSLKSIEVSDIGKILQKSDATLKVAGTISQFEWLNLLLKNSLNLTFDGNGEIKADLAIKQGLLAQGSKIDIVPKDLSVGLLDYLFHGNGAFHFDVSKGGAKPTAGFKLLLHDAKMKRRSEKQAMIEHVEVRLNGEIKDIDLDAKQKDIDLYLQIPSAKVRDITVYNSHIPKNSPLKLTKGTADMQADIKLSANDARGFVKMTTHGLTMKVDDQIVSARLRIDAQINGGVPKNMAFNVAGTSIVLDQARVVGKKSSYKQSGWSAKVQLKKADVVWRKPVRLRSETTLQIKDSRPIVAMIDNQRNKHNWLSKLITIENIHGRAIVNMANRVISIPDAYVKSDKIDIGAKGVIASTLREGMFLLRYKKFKLLLKLRNGKKNIDILHVQKTYDNYRVPHAKDLH